MSQVCRISDWGSAKSWLDLVPAGGLEALGHAARPRIGELPGREVAVVGDLEHVLRLGRAQDLARSAAPAPAAPHWRRPAAPAESVPSRAWRRWAGARSGWSPRPSRAGRPLRWRGRQCGRSRAPCRSCARTRSRRIRAGRSPAVPCRQWPAVAMTSWATQKAVHTIGRRLLKNSPIFSCTSLYLAGTGVRSSPPNTATGRDIVPALCRGAGCQAGARPAAAVAAKAKVTRPAPARNKLRALILLRPSDGLHGALLPTFNATERPP